MKLANTGGEVGVIVEDRLSGVVGRLGTKARMIPLQMTVRRGDDPPETFEFELARNATLLPMLTSLVVANPLIRHVASKAESTLHVTGRVRMVDLPDLPIEMSFAGDAPALSVANNMNAILTGLSRNPFAELEIEGIDVDVEVRPEVIRYRLEGLRYDRGGVRPGEKLEIGCLLRRYRGETEVRTLVVDVPEALVEGAELHLLVGPPSQVDRAWGCRPRVA